MNANDFCQFTRSAELNQDRHAAFWTCQWKWKHCLKEKPSKRPRVLIILRNNVKSNKICCLCWESSGFQVHSEHGFPKSSHGAHIPSLVEWEQVQPHHLNQIIYISKSNITIMWILSLSRSSVIKIKGPVYPKSRKTFFSPLFPLVPFNRAAECWRCHH